MNNLKTSTKNVLIASVATIIGGAMGATATYTHTIKNENNNSTIVNIDGKSFNRTSDEYEVFVKKIVADNENLQEEIQKLKKDIEESKKNQGTLSNQNQIETDGEKKALLDVAKTINACSDYEERKVEPMSLRGEDYSNGFILHSYSSGKEEGVEFKLGKKYRTMSFDIGHLDESDKKGTFVLTYYLDGQVQEEISTEPEMPVQHFEIDLRNADIIKFNWSNTKGYAKYGVANVMVE